MTRIPPAYFVAVTVPHSLCTPELVEALDRHPEVVSPVTVDRGAGSPFGRRTEVIIPVRPISEPTPPRVIRDQARRIVAAHLDGVAAADLAADITTVGPSVHDAAYEAMEALRKALEALPVRDPFGVSTVADSTAYPLDQIERMVANHEHWRCPDSARQRTQP